jgi:hypothetical protein
VEPESNDANVYPTQTFPAPAPANRADRRAEGKKLPFDKLKDIKK